MTLYGITVDYGVDYGDTLLNPLSPGFYPRLLSSDVRDEGFGKASPQSNYERDPPPMRRGPARVRRPVGQDHVTLASARLAVGLGAMVAASAYASRRAS